MISGTTQLFGIVGDPISHVRVPAVLNAVFDATALRLWVSYAGGGLEAYQRPFVSLDLTKLDGDGDGRSDLAEGGRDSNGDGRPDFLDAQELTASVSGASAR